jgi:diphthamide biosynthesis protein 2
MSVSFSSLDSAAIERQVEAEEKSLKLSDIWTANDLNRCIKFIREKFLSRICLQFSDNILHLAIEIEGQLKKHVDSNIFILADTSYGSCCVDEVTPMNASHQ